MDGMVVYLAIHKRGSSASLRNDKNIFIVENYTRNIHRLPSNIAEVESRAKDILFVIRIWRTSKCQNLLQDKSIL